MIYAMRYHNQSRVKTLIEFKSIQEMNHLDSEDVDHEYWYYDPTRARQWVMNGNPHETGLYIDNGKVRYARANP